MTIADENRSYWSEFFMFGSEASGQLEAFSFRSFGYRVQENHE